MVKSIVTPPQIAAMLIQMGKTWYSMFKFLEAYLMPEAYSNCAAICLDDVAADTPSTASSLEVSIPTALVIQ